MCTSLYRDLVATRDFVFLFTRFNSYTTLYHEIHTFDVLMSKPYSVIEISINVDCITSNIYI